MKGLAAYLLAILLLTIALSIHLKAMLSASDDSSKGAYLINLLKDTAMAMGAILIGNNRPK
jgi:hypothetical protein